MSALETYNFYSPAFALVPLVALVSAFVVRLLGFALKTAIGSRPRTD